MTKKVNKGSRFIAIMMTIVLTIVMMPTKVSAANYFIAVFFQNISAGEIDFFMEYFYLYDASNDKQYNFEKESDNRMAVNNLPGDIKYEIISKDGITMKKGQINNNTTLIYTRVNTINVMDGTTVLDNIYTLDFVSLDEKYIDVPQKDGYTFLGWVDESGNKVEFPIKIGSDGVISIGGEYNIYASWGLHNHDWDEDNWCYDNNAHWHECLADGCPIIDNTAKDGYVVHEMGQWITVIEAKFSETGLKERNCKICDYKEEEVIPKLSDNHVHDFTGPEQIVNKPTCTEEGNKYIYCTEVECGAYKEEKIDKVPHEYEKEWKWDENTHYHECENCSAHKDDEASHEMGEWLIITEPKFNETGLKERKCKTCDYKEEEVIPKLSDNHEHDFTGPEEIVRKPTCTEDGNKYIYCTEVECGAYIEQKIERLNHAYKTEWCYDDETHYHECENCGKYTDQENHNMKEGDIIKLPTEMAPGVQEMICEVCGYIDYVEIPYVKSVPNPEPTPNPEPVPNPEPTPSPAPTPEKMPESLDKEGENAEPPYTAPVTGDIQMVHIYATTAMIAGLSYILLYFKPITIHMTEEKKEELVLRLVRWGKNRNRLVKAVAITAITIILLYYHCIGKNAIDISTKLKYN